MSRILTSTIDGVRNYAGSIAWGPLVSLSRSVILSLLHGIQVGQLTVVEVNGVKTICGRSSNPSTELRIEKDAFWLRLALFGDMVGNCAPELVM